jgi:hypothetical protein
MELMIMVDRRQKLKLILALLSFGVLLSCSSSRPKTSASANSYIKPTADATLEQPNKQPRIDGVRPPELFRSEGVRIEKGVKILTVGNVQGHYLLSCNTNLDSCVTPIPGKDYLLFTKTTRWKFPGAKDFVTLEWIQGWSGSYNNEENMALLPEDGHRSTGWGTYWLRSWNKNK